MAGPIESSRTPPGRQLDRDELRLVDALRAGRESAIAEVEGRYGRVISGFLHEALADRGSVEDVRQQVMLEIWRRGPEYDPERAAPLTWMLMIARSRASDERRRRRPEPIDPASVEETADRDGLEPLLERWRLAALLDRLPAQEAGLLRLRFYEGLSQTEIAARTGIALGTIKRRMVDGLVRLRAMIEAEAR